MNIFVSYHALVPFEGVIYNYGENGLAKEIPIGGAARSGITAQCQNARERPMLADSGLPLTIRSRMGFDKYVRRPLERFGATSEEAVTITRAVCELLFNRKPEDCEENRIKTLKRLEERAQKASNDVSKAEKTLEEATNPGAQTRNRASLISKRAALARAEAELEEKDAELKGLVRTDELLNPTTIEFGAFEEVAKEAYKNYKENSSKGDWKTRAFKATRKAYASFLKRLPDDDALAKKINFRYGIDVASTGRMSTSDVLRRVDGSLARAYAYTIHPSETAPDPFVAVDTLADEYGLRGAAHKNERQLTSNIFYYFRALDTNAHEAHLNGLLDGDPEEVAKQLRFEIQRHVFALANPPPGAKKGSTAPFSHAMWIMVEVGRSPVTTLKGFHHPVDFEGNVLANGYKAASKYYNEYLENFEPDVQRAMMVIGPKEDMTIPGERLSVKKLAAWAADQVYSLKKG